MKIEEYKFKQASGMKKGNFVIYGLFLSNGEIHYLLVLWIALLFKFMFNYWVFDVVNQFFRATENYFNLKRKQIYSD